MLVLHRKVQEEIILDGGITIKVTQLGDGWVKLGIEAPDDVKILRRELVDPDYLLNDPAPRPIRRRPRIGRALG